MATRSRIGLQLKNGNILSVYHHWDGYPEWLGRILRTHYNTREKIAELIDGGDMSCCWTDDHFRTEEGIEKKDKYGPQYYSERGEDTPPVLHQDLNEFLIYTDQNCGGEYAYQFVNGEWVCYDVRSNPYDPNLVKEVPIPHGNLGI